MSELVQLEIVNPSPAPFWFDEPALAAQTEQPIFLTDKAGNHGYAVWLNPRSRSLHTFIPCLPSEAVAIIASVNAHTPDLRFSIHLLGVL